MRTYLKNLKLNSMLQTSILQTVIFSALIYQNVFAWGDLGHQTVAEIAERKLSPKAKLMVSDILGNGPLAEAATYPDLVRSDDSYKEFSGYHFVEIDPLWGEYKKVPSALRAERDANSLLSEVPERLFSKSKLDSVRMASEFNKNQKKDLLRYLVHLVGDVHQPLHVGNGYDAGANFCNIKYPDIRVSQSKESARDFSKDSVEKGTNETNEEAEVVKYKNSDLHSFWDVTLVDHVFSVKKMNDPQYKFPKYKGFKDLADLILSEEQKIISSNDNLNTQDLNTWYKEAQALHKDVYPDKVPNTQPKERTYCRRFIKNEKGEPVKDQRGVTITEPATTVAEVDANYMNVSTEIIKKQIYKAGVRLAHVLNKMAEPRYGNSLKEDAKTRKTKDLRKILDSFNNSKEK